MRAIVLARRAVVLSTAAALVSACDDAPLTPRSQNISVDSISNSGSEARSRLHRRNSQEWIGQSHNRALDDFRKSLTNPETMSGRFCDHIIRFAASSERIPSGRPRSDSLSQIRVTASVVSLSPFCASKVSARALITSPLSTPGASLGINAVQAYDLIAQIDAAIDAASNSYELAWQLNAILDQAQSLDEFGRLLISATVSVAQNSFEYWESNYPAVAQEVAASCELQVRDSSFGDSTSPCFDNIYGAAYLKMGGAGRLDVAFDEGDGVRDGVKAIVKADAGGAFAGAFNGFLNGMALAGPVGAFDGAMLGALGGGAGASIVVAGGLAAREWCRIMHCGGKK